MISNGKNVFRLLMVATFIMISTTSVAQARGPILTAAPETSLVDEPVQIDVTGCRPGQVVALRAATFDDEGMRWESRATFEADAEGRVDPGTMAPNSGTYDGVHPMGLFWSMRKDEGPRGGFDSDELDPLEVVLQLEIDGEVRESRRLIRQRVLPSVTRREVRDRGLVGTLLAPGSGSSAGAIIVIGGSGGGLDEGWAALLASHGFTALALAYFGEASLPEALSEIPLEYFQTAIRFLGEQDGIDERVGVLGASRGGELALLLGAIFPQIRGVVAVVPSGVVWAGCCTPEAFGRPAWTYNGEPITPLQYDRDDPDLLAHDAEVAKQIRAGEPVAHTPGFRLSLEKATNLEAATIPVEKTQGPILLISAGADALWPSAELAEISVTRLREHDFPFDFEHVSYEDAGHVFPQPYLPNPTISGRNFFFGGTPADNAKAAADSWSRILAFFEETIGR